MVMDEIVARVTQLAPLLLDYSNVITLGKFALSGSHYFKVILFGSHDENVLNSTVHKGSPRFTCPVKVKEQYILSTLCEPL